jgi:Peptidase A4 family
MKTITLNEKVKVRTFTPPPAGFNPLAASAAELAKYGFPAKPESAEQQDLYKRLFGQMTGQFQYVEPTLQITPKKRHGIARTATVKQSAGSDIDAAWSGGLVLAPTGMSFHWVTGEWVVPNVAPLQEDGDYYSAVWLGLDGNAELNAGGVSSSDVVQAGVNCDVSRQNGKATQPTVYLWCEWFQDGADTGEISVGNLKVNAGDTVAVTIFTTGPGATEATIYFTNVTQWVGTTPLVIPAPPGVSLLGNCAEWVVERPTIGYDESGAPILGTLADYGQVFFAGCNALAYAPNGSSEIVPGAEISINMVNNDETIASYGALVAPTVVECSYNRFQ